MNKMIIRSWQPGARIRVSEAGNVVHARWATTFPCASATEELSELTQSCFGATGGGRPSGFGPVGICWGVPGLEPIGGAGASVLRAGLWRVVGQDQFRVGVNLDNAAWLCLPPASGIRCAEVLVVSVAAAALRRLELFWSKA